MINRKALWVFVFIGIVFLSGCTTATLKTFVSPSIQPGSISNVAIFPMRNARLLPDESREINRGISQTFHEKNPNVKILGPAEATDLLSKSGLADKYSDFLRNYAASGMPNITVLKEIGDSLKVDAILQGEVFDIYQIDGVFGIARGKTSITVRYALLSTISGEVLWEATSRVVKENTTTIGPAPPLYDVIIAAQNKILTALPKLGE